MRRVSPSLLVGAIALVLALTGVAGALEGKKTIDKNDLRKNVVKSKTIKDGQVKEGDFAESEIAPLALINDWARYSSETGPAAAVKDPAGVVHLEGAIYRASGSSENPFRLPAGFRPAQLIYEPIDTSSANYGRVLIYPDGTAVVDGSSAPNFTSLEGVTFRAAG